MPLKSGADAVKFQIYKTFEKIMSKKTIKLKTIKIIHQKTVQFVKKNELTFSQFRILKNFCIKQN